VIDISNIRNPKLRILVEESKFFKALPEKKQIKYIQQFNDLPPELQGQFIDFLKEKVKKEATEREQKMKVYSEMVNKENMQLIKDAKNDRMKTLKKNDMKQSEKILNSL